MSLGMGARRWKLRVVSGVSTGEVYDLRSERVRIGRTRGDVKIPSDGRISSAHAELHFERARGSWAIRDMHSANGTRVNGESVFVRNLIPGDRIKLGATEMVLEEDDGNGSFASPQAPSGPPKLSVIQGGAGALPAETPPQAPTGARAADAAVVEAGAEAGAAKPKRRADVVSDFAQALSGPGKFFEQLGKCAPDASSAVAFLLFASGIGGVLAALLTYYGYIGDDAGVLRTLLSTLALPVGSLILAGLGATLVLGFSRLSRGPKLGFARAFEAVSYSFAPVAAVPIFLAVPSYGKFAVAIPLLACLALCFVALPRLRK